MTMAGVSEADGGFVPAVAEAAGRAVGAAFGVDSARAGAERHSCSGWCNASAAEGDGGGSSTCCSETCVCGECDGLLAAGSDGGKDDCCGRTNAERPVSTVL